MSKVTSALRVFERRIAARRPQRTYIVTHWADDDHVTDADGRRWLIDDWRAAHPDAITVQLTWGDDDRQLDEVQR